MQLITNLSKYLIFALLSCSLVLITTWKDENVDQVDYFSAPYTPSIDPIVLTPAHSDNTIWSSIRSEFKLDHQAQTAQVQAEIHKLLADQNKLYSILKAAAPYIYFIHQQTEARGLPSELALIPVIESEFNPNDHSTKGATGLWQLMPQTARELGIKVHGNYDGRRDVVASTKAALAYFNDLGNFFKGNWYLAIAAYDCGQGKVQSAERRTGTDDFWKLPLPQETKQYVPKLLAVAAIVNNPKKYGVTLPAVTNKPYFTQLTVKKPVSLAKVAKKSGIDVKTLHTLNPDYNHGIIPKKGTYTVLMPVAKAPIMTAQLSTPNTASKTNAQTAIVKTNATSVTTTVSHSSTMHKSVAKKTLATHHVKTIHTKAKKHTSTLSHIHRKPATYHFETVHAMEVKSRSV